MLAEITFIGYLADKPEIKDSDGRKYACARVSTDFYKKIEGKIDTYTMWHTIFINDKFDVDKAVTFEKGDLIYSQGSLRYSEWVDKEGVHHIAPYQNANKIKLLRKGKFHLEKDEIATQNNTTQNTELKSKAVFDIQEKNDYEDPFIGNSYDEDLPF